MVHLSSRKEKRVRTRSTRHDGSKASGWRQRSHVAAAARTLSQKMIIIFNSIEPGLVGC